MIVVKWKKSHWFSTENTEKVLYLFFIQLSKKKKKNIQNLIFLEISKKLQSLHTIFNKQVIYFVNKKHSLSKLTS